MTVKKTESIWDDIASLILNFLKKHWWKLGILIFLAGVAVSSFSIKIGNTEIKKGQAPIDGLKKHDAR